MAGRPSPIQTLFSHAPDSCLGSGRLSSVAAGSKLDDAPSNEDTRARSGDVLMLAGRRGKFAEARMAPTLTVQVCGVRGKVEEKEEGVRESGGKRIWGGGRG